MQYNPAYWDSYYGDSYENTYRYGYSPGRIIQKKWRALFGEPLPRSFADIGCGPGQHLRDMGELLGPDALLYGVEIQEIPPERRVSGNILIGDFLEMYPQLPQVECLFVTCSMYIPWDRQGEFLWACSQLATKAAIFLNLYLEDGSGIPEDSLRRVIYRSRQDFSTVVGSLGFTRSGFPVEEFYVKRGPASNL